MSDTPTLDKYLGDPDIRKVADDEHRRWLKGLSPPLKVAEHVADVAIRNTVKKAKEAGKPFSYWGPLYEDQPVIVHEVMRAWNPRDHLRCCECLSNVSSDCRIEPCPLCRLRIARCPNCSPKSLPTTVRSHLRHLHGTVAAVLPGEERRKG